MKILCAGESESFKFATPIGVGLIDSAINLTKLIIDKKPNSLLFIGSAGSYGNLQLFDIFHSCSSTNIETGYFLNNCYTPKDNKVVSKWKDVSCETTNDKNLLVNSSNYITTNKSISNEFLKNGIEAENMEFYSILTVAKKYNIPAFGIFIITNHCDNQAHNNFLKNHKEAKEKLTLYIKKQVSNI